MKHLFRKTMCVAVAVLLLVGSLVCAQAATVVDSGTYADGISWALDSENTLHVYGSGAMTDYACPWHDYQPVIEKVIVYSGITHIGGQAFTDCTALADVSVPDSVTSIGVNAFFNCTSLTEIEIPDSVTDIYDDAFTNSGYYNDKSNWENGVLYIDEFLIEGKTDISGECVIKDGTRIISYGAFQRCNSMTRVVVPDSVKTISKRAFIECAALESVTLPDSITTIDENAFFECTSLTNIVIPENVTVLSEYLFYGCSSLASVTIPASVTSIEQSAFDATSLTDVYYTGSETQWNAITVGQYNAPLENAVVHYNYQPGNDSADDILPGDIDFDGAVTATDARLALRVSVGLDSLSAQSTRIADVDKDGQITAADARLILRASVGLD